MRIAIALALVITVSAFVGISRSHDARAGIGVDCVQSYPLFSGFSGHWTGTWQNHTFSSNGNLTLDAVVNDDCTASATVTGIYDQVGSHTINATFRDDGTSTVVEVQNDSLFGDVTLTIGQDGTLTMDGSGAQQDIATYEGTGSAEPGHIEVDLTFHFGAGGSATESFELTQDATPTPTISPTPEPTPTPTETPQGELLVWADWNCSGGADPIDSLLTLRFDAGLTTNTGDCPDMGTAVEVLIASALTWGDADCSGGADPVDSLKLLRFDAGLSVAQGAGCPVIGSDVIVSDS